MWFLDRDFSFLKRSLETPWLMIWKNPHSLQAKEREDKEDEDKGCDISNIGSLMAVLDLDMII